MCTMLILLFAFIKTAIVHSQNILPIQSVSITPKSANTNGVYILTHIDEVTNANDNNQWRISTTYQHTWHFIIILDDRWTFNLNLKSSLSFTIRSATFPQSNAFIQADDDIILGFAASNNEYISMAIPIGNNHAINTNKIYPNCYPTNDIKSDFAFGNIATLPNGNRRCDVARGDCQHWSNMQPEMPQMFNTFPITVTFINDPSTDTLQLQLHSLTSSIQTCNFKSFPPNQGFKIYFGGNENGQSFDINAFDFEYNIIKPTTEPSISPTVNTPLPTLITYAPSLKPTSNPTLNPLINPTLHPSNNPTLKPSNNPTLNPSINPTLKPSINPTFKPSVNPSINPTLNPTLNPSINPTLNPTKNPTLKPSNDPTLNLLITHILKPSNNPTLKPSNNPTLKPSNNPTLKPSNNPTLKPSNNPTLKPSNNPTLNPSNNPTLKPSNNPTLKPSNNPTLKPSNNPTLNPSNNPTLKPSNNPTDVPVERVILPVINIPSGPILWTDIYYDNMEINNGWFTNNEATFGYSSSRHCPTSGSKCVRINGCDISRGGDSYIEKVIDITGYNSIRLKIDFKASSLETGDECQVLYAYGSETDKQAIGFTIDNTFYRNELIDLPNPTDNYLKIMLLAHGSSISSPCGDRCFWGDFYVQGSK